MARFIKQRKTRQLHMQDETKKTSEKRHPSSANSALEQDLKQQNELLTSIMNDAPIAMYAKDIEGRYLFINRKGLEWLGVSDDEVSGKTDHDLFSPEVAERTRKEDLDVIHTQTPFEIERSQIFEGDLFAVHISKFPLFNSDGEISGVCGMTYNITEHKHTEEELLQQNEKLQQHVKQRTAELETVRRELNALVDTVSYTLKASMRRIIQPAVWLVKNYVNVFDERGRKMATLLINRIKWMGESLEGIGQYFSLGYAEESMQQIDLNALITEVLTSLAPSPHLQIWIGDHLPIILGDQNHITLIFRNLLSNALKFMDKPEGKIAIDCVDEGAYWTFSVADSGPGIAQKYHKKIFQPFQTTVPEHHQKHTGIGLAMVQKIVERYEGQLWVESVPGEGSTFFFTFPKSANSR